MIIRVNESTSHYEPVKDFRIKNMKSSDKKAFWTSVYYRYKKAIVGHQKMSNLLPSDPYMIKFMKNPSKDEQMAAILTEPKVLKYISNPDPYTQLRAIKVNPYLIKYVKNPTEEMWVWAIVDNPRLILKNPKPTWFMVKLAQEKKVQGLNTHKGLTDEMKSYLALVA